MTFFALKVYIQITNLKALLSSGVFLLQNKTFHFSVAMKGIRDYFPDLLLAVQE